jgi:hypothetical protein
LISCAHCAPAGGFEASTGTHGSTNPAGRYATLDHRG